MNAHIDETAQHACYAPSSAHRWTQCTASATAIAALGEQEEGEEAAEGTRAHDEIERCLGAAAHFSNGMQPLPVNPDHPAAFGVALVLDYVRQLPPGRLWVEQRVRLTDQIWGRCDVAHWDDATGILTIVDYKNGHVGVDAEENEQLRIYAAGSIYTHNLPAKWIRYVVVQPRDFRPVPPVKQWHESADDLFAFATKTAAIPYGPLTFVAGEQCTYCPLFGICSASRDLLANVGALVAGLMTADQVTPAQRALFLACKKPIADAFKNAEKIWQKEALQGAAAPGLKVVTSQGHKAWSDPEAARALVLERLGPSGLDVPTPAQAIERGIPADVVNPMAPRPSGGPVLAFESDKRPEWKARTGAEMFKGVTG